MPQKRNPVDAMSALAAARLALTLVPTLMSGLEQEHERADRRMAGRMGGGAAAVPLHRRRRRARSAALEGLEVHEDRMRRNLDLAGGTLMAEALASPSLRISDASTRKTR
jgi:3-carboxy-cis,cis-muconate cycloisomerase